MLIMVTKKRAIHAITILEMMIVVTIIGIILFIAVPSWLRQREQSRGVACQENLTKIEHAKEMYIFEKRLNDGDPVDMTDLWQQDGKGYLKYEPHCPGGGIYSANPVNTAPTCSFNGHEVYEGIAQHKIQQ
jgi:Tfp pilus assembly protein PilE